MKLDENYIIINNENIDNRLEKNTEILNNILLKIFLLFNINIIILVFQINIFCLNI